MKWTYERLCVAALHALVLVLTLLALYVRQLPPSNTAIPEAGSAESLWWGLWPVTYLPDWIFYLGVGLILLTLGLAWCTLCAQQVPFARHWGRLASHFAPGLWYAPLLLSFTVAFFAFPVIHTRWGDAYILTKAIAHPDPALQLTHSWQAPLDLLLHSQIWRYFHGPMGWTDAMPVYHLLSPLAGLLYLGAAVAVSQESLRRSAVPGWLTFGLVTSIGVMQLFFGYIENYSFAAAGILIYLWLGVAVLRNERPLWVAALALAITNALHPSTIVYGPSLLYLGWQTSKRRNNSWGCNVLSIALPLAIVAIATVLIMTVGGHGLGALFTTDRPGGGDGRWLVPLWETSTRWEHYTMLSWPHLRDLVNQQLLVAPVLLPALLLAAVGSAIRRARRGETQGTTVGENADVRLGNRHATLFLGSAAAGHLLLTWIWNPDYGGQRDWDLFSLAAIPTALLVAHVLARCITNQRALVAGAIPLLVLQYALLVTWVYQNTLPWEWP